MAKIERKYLAHYVDTSASGENPVYERLGKDLEEFSAELSAQVDTKKNRTVQGTGLGLAITKNLSADAFTLNIAADVKVGGITRHVCFDEVPASQIMKLIKK